MDEREEMKTQLGNLQQLVTLTDAGVQAKPANRAMEIMLQMVSGTNSIHSLVLTAATSSLFPEGDKKIETLSTELWHHSQGCGLAARIIASNVHYPAPEEAFVGGLLHDIGRLANLLHFPEKYERIEAQFRQGKDILALEQQHLDCDHTTIGQMLAEKWHLPPLLQACIEQHHAPLEASEACRMLTTIVSLADYLSLAYSNENDLPKPATILAVEEELGLNQQRMATIERQVAQQFGHLAALEGRK